MGYSKAAAEIQAGNKDIFFWRLAREEVVLQTQIGIIVESPSLQISKDKLGKYLSGMV